MATPRTLRSRAALAALALVAPLGLLSTGVADAADPDLPLAPTDVAFGATVPADVQRDAGEPAVTMARDGLIYTCGISGFSQVADYAQVSDDDGDQFHLLGTAPRGQISAGEGGGDCALATSPVPDANGDHTLAYAGLGPLTNFSTFTSNDSGQTLQASPISESIPGVDRQWITFTDVNTAFLTYNAFPSGEKVVQRSTNGGLTYGLRVVAAAQSGRIGQIRSFLPVGQTDVGKSFVYFPYSTGNNVKIALSQDNGTTYSQCLVIDAGVSPEAGFVAADHDDAGNIYVTYSEKGGGRDTYVVALPADRFTDCKGTGTAAQNNTDPGWSPKVRVNRGGVNTSLFPWVAASGLPGRSAVATYGTTAIGNPDDGAFDAAWDVYVNPVVWPVGTNGVIDVSQTPTVAQVKATTHPFHYDSICTNGLGCTIANADRSLIDYFTMEFNEQSGKLALVYSQSNKKPDDPAGFVATPAVLTQVAGQSNGPVVDGGFRKQVVRTASPDPAGDATVNYSFLTAPGVTVPPQARRNVPALDLVDDGGQAVTVGPELNLTSGQPVAEGGFTVTMRYDDLSNAALQNALTAATPASQSLTYLFRFTDGFQTGAAVAFWDPARGFRFGYNDYVTGGAPNCGPATDNEKCLLYPGNEAIQGSVDQVAGTITLSVPRSKLEALGGPDASGQRPTQTAATTGSRMYDATAVSLASPTLPEAQTFMTPVDNAPAFDFLIGAAASGPDVVIPEVPLPALLPLVAVALGGGLLLVRRSRRSRLV